MALRTAGRGVGLAGVTLADGSLVPADAVVGATGGFGGSAELLAAFAPHLSHAPFTAAASATGEGHRICESAGARLVDMELVQLHPIAF